MATNAPRRLTPDTPSTPRIHRKAEQSGSSPDPGPAVPVDHPERSVSSRLSRLLNICVAGIGIVVTAPLMAIIATLVKVTSRGPVLYVQDRVGVDRRSRNGSNPRTRRVDDKGGRIFRIYKFRTMRVGSDQRQIWASPDDNRVTSVGRFLRSSRLDELPQLFNVVLGDMNIVGPRPEQPEIFQSLREQIDRYPERQRVLPGITGLAQVSQAYDRNLDDVRSKVSYDLEYIERKGPLRDMWIMLKTLPVVIKRLGW